MDDNNDPIEGVDETWQRICARAVQLTGSEHGSRAWLARKLGMTPQRLGNWGKRGVPARALPDIAAALGWSINQVLGLAEPPATWPFETIARERFDGLTPRQAAMVEFAVLRELERIEQSRKQTDQAA